MKKTKRTWLAVFNRLLSLLLLLLGFGSCGDDNGGGMVMYGMPPAKYSVKANVLDETNKPIEGIRVSVKTNKYDNHTIGGGLTNAQGIFEDRVYEPDVNVVCEDVDGEANGVFEKDSVQADISKLDDSRFEFTIKLKAKK